MNQLITPNNTFNYDDITPRLLKLWHLGKEHKPELQSQLNDLLITEGRKSISSFSNLTLSDFIELGRTLTAEKNATLIQSLPEVNCSPATRVSLLTLSQSFKLNTMDARPQLSMNRGYLAQLEHQSNQSFFRRNRTNVLVMVLSILFTLGISIIGAGILAPLGITLSLAVTSVALFLAGSALLAGAINLFVFCQKFIVLL